MDSTLVVEGFRLSPQQRRLWALQQDAGPDASPFRAHLVLLAEGELRPAALREALEQVCARHEALRSSFRRLPGVLLPVQAVEDGAPPAWRDLDLSGAAEAEQAARLEELLALESRRGFDFGGGPLVEAALFKLSPERHLLSLRAPALCADRRTLANLFAELAQLYEAALAGAELEGEPLQYVQFSEWQNTLWEEEEAEEGKEFWRRQDLSAAAAPLPGPRRAARAARVELRTLKSALAPAEAARVRAVAGRYETTPAAVLLSAWQTLLWRLTQQPVIVGCVCEGRAFEPLHDACGLFARALPVRCEFAEGLRYAEALEQVEASRREAAEWLDYFRWEGASAGGAPAYFTFGYEFSELQPARLAAGLRLSVYRLDCYAERFDLKLTCVQAGDALGLEFDYDGAAFGEEDVRRLSEQFRTLLGAALADPEAPVEELELVPEAERRRVVSEWNRTRRHYRLESCLHELFERQVERTPDAVAAVFQGERLTFGELNRRANQLAHHLRARGVGPEAAVGLRVERSLEMLVGVLGVLKAGGAYVPLDPQDPRERVARVLRDAGAAVLLTQDSLAGAEFGDGTQVVRLDADRGRIAAEAAENPRSGAAPENLAYVIYTSGSTGQPKGVMVQHRSAVNLAAALREEVYAGLGPALRVGLNAPLAFDASVKQLLQLLSGHTLYVMPEELRLDAVRSLAYLDEHALDVLDCTPSQLKLLLDAGLGTYAGRVPRVMLVGGEPLDDSLWPRLAADTRTRFFNVYGPTECTVDATWVAAQDAPERPTIGRPIPNARAYVLDKKLRPVAVHMTGELYVGGEGLARGYLKRAGLTAERFVPDCFGGEPGARLYRTGDLARFLADGRIEFVGRNDSQVKVRGHRVELGEVEAALARLPGVRQAAVVARGGAQGVRLAAYVVCEAGAGEAGELRRAAAELLPDYMVPAFFVALDELPLTRNGKVDLKALPAPEAARRPAGQGYVAPRNDIEQAIARVWQEVLEVERVGVHDNFFDAGGHSLLMVQVHNRLREAFRKEVSIVEMFRKPTVSALAEYFADGGGPEPSLDKVIARAERRRQARGRRQP